MCGIAALVGLGPGRLQRPLPQAVLETMVAALRHRGPDHQATLVRGAVGLGHTRLSIIDCSPAADQPFLSPAGDLALIYNGEIFNYLDLREELIALGQQFRTESDTEVLLLAYRQWGEDCLARLNGMFGFVLCDLARGRLFAARDRFGIKPLHYARCGDYLLFASEIKALNLALRTPPLAPPPRFAAARLTELLLYREAIRNDLLTDIHSLEPGTALSLALDSPLDRPRPDAPAGVAPRTWFHVAALPDAHTSARLQRLSTDARCAALEATLQAAVERHLVSDVPVGSLCSGGLDSSLMTALACRLRPDVRVYHVDVAAVSERAWAEQVARHLQIEIEYFRLDRANYLAGYIDAIWHNDAPLTHPQNVPIERISALARAQGCKVLLTGEGADEAFGGYDWRYRLRWNWLRLQRWTWLWRRLTRKTVFALTDLWLTRAPDPLLFRAWGDPFAVLEIGADQGFRADLERRCQAAYGFIPRAADRVVQAAMTADLRDYVGAILHQQDRASMQAGVEARVPFLDIEVARFAANLPRADRCDRRQGKRLLKALALRHLPRAVVTRPKVGFASPAHDWVLSLGLDCFQDGFLAQECALAPDYTADLLARAPADLTHMLYGLEFWGRMFIRGETRAALTERFVHGR